MRFIDGHCDVLYKLWKQPNASFYTTNSFDVTFDFLCKSHVMLQVFAIFVPPTVPAIGRFRAALIQVDLFYTHILSDDLFLITSQRGLHDLDHKKKALLALEGADALSGEISYLRHFFRLGVRQIGLTWNYANEVADGIQEVRGGGLTLFGHQVVDEMSRLGMILDVSHLSVKGFWEVLEKDVPVLASHSNAKNICNHVRNLDDEQIKALIAKKGLIGITFVPGFVYQKDPKISHILKHIEHICSLGGEDHLCFGSDFDGIVDKIPGLENMGCLHNLHEALLKAYDEQCVKKWFFNNANQFYLKHLP